MPCDHTLCSHVAKFVCTLYTRVLSLIFCTRPDNFWCFRNDDHIHTCLMASLSSSSKSFWNWAADSWSQEHILSDFTWKRNIQINICNRNIWRVCQKLLRLPWKSRKKDLIQAVWVRFNIALLWHNTAKWLEDISGLFYFPSLGSHALLTNLNF